MIDGQTNIFEMLYPTYKITKPIRLIELFAGYGSQALALKYLGVEFEHWKICEWAIKSIQAYKDIHFTDDNTDYFSQQPFNESWLTSWLYEKGVSSNYNEPMKKEQVMRLSNETKKKIYNNIVATHNLVNIQNVKGKDLKIVDTDKYDYILTYSFPCQDLIATDYGIPQTRNRTFMVSILGDYNYTFAKPIPLKLKLKDMLEDNVDEKYYLSNEKLLQISNWNSYKNPLDTVMGKESLCTTVTTRIAESQDGGINASMKVYCDNLENTTNLRINNKSLQETLQKNNIDDTCYIDTYNKKIDKEKSGTITTGVSFRNNTFLADGNLRIRKLTPRERFRLMGVKDEDFDKVAKNQSDSSLYHLAGDSIVCQCLEAIFKEMIE